MLLCIVCALVLELWGETPVSKVDLLPVTEIKLLGGDILDTDPPLAGSCTDRSLDNALS